MDVNNELSKTIDEYNKLTLITNVLKDLIMQMNDKKDFVDIVQIFKEKMEKYNNYTKYFNKNEEHTLLFISLTDYKEENKFENSEKTKNLIETKFMEAFEYEIKKFIKNKKNVMNQLNYNFQKGK